MNFNSMIETERLIIRRFKPEDWKDLHEYLSDETVVRFEPYDPFTEDESKSESIRRSGDESFFAVTLKDTGKVIGNLYFGKGDFDTYEIGYVFHANYWGQGFATESTNALMNYAFHTGKVRRIIAECNPENTSSWKLLERLKMRREGHLLKNIYFFTDEKNQPIWQDTYQYAILVSEWKE